jgi:peptidoglycan/LPS O-acetylase OafA/YrhL
VGSLPAALQWLAIVLPVSALYAWASTVLLERPVRRWARRLAVTRERGVVGVA